MRMNNNTIGRTIHSNKVTTRKLVALWIYLFIAVLHDDNNDGMRGCYAYTTFQHQRSLILSPNNNNNIGWTKNRSKNKNNNDDNNNNNNNARKISVQVRMTPKENLQLNEDNISNKNKNGMIKKMTTSSVPTTITTITAKTIKVCASIVVTVLLTSPFSSCLAVSGGGLDYANLDISGQDFSKGNYKGKDFAQVIAKATTFSGSNLVGCRFYKAYLQRADFSSTDLRGASLEDTSMDDADLTNAVAVGSYFSSSLYDVKSITNADFTDAQIPLKTIKLICDKKDFAIGTNPITGADTRDSLMCP